MEVLKFFLIVYNGEVLDWYDTLKEAIQATKEDYEGASIVRAACMDYGDYQSPWACGATFRDAYKNLENNIFDNWSDFE